MLRRRTPQLFLALVTVAAIGYGSTLQVPQAKSDGRTHGIFWSDEATYHSMAYSLAFDGDLQYERRDLERIYAAGYGGGPSGLFLVRNPNDQGLYFAKAYAYPLLAAPFVRLFGDNGFFILHAALLGLMLAAGFSYAARTASAEHAALYAFTYVAGSVATVYFFWLTPEWFNLALLFLATFLWLYKHAPPAQAGPAPGPGWLTGGWTDFAAAALYAVAIYSKPPNIILVAPLLLWPLVSGRWRRAIALGLVTGAVTVALFAGTWATLGHPNYQGGERKSFDVITGYPLMSPEATFDTVGHPMTTAVQDLTALPAAATFGRDLIYVLVGRNGGMLPYMFPAVLALLAFAAAPGRRWRSPHAFLAVFWLLQIVAIVVVVKGNWIGGGGTLGSRYFVNSYAVMFFVLPATVGLLSMAASWLVWSLFLAQIVINPFGASIDPSAHTRQIPYTLLPTEVTILHNLPFNTRPRTRRQTLDDPPTYFAYFLDDNTWLRENPQGGFWLKGGREAELVIRTTAPAESLQITLRNRTLENTVILRHGASRIERRLDVHDTVTVSLPTSEPHDYFGTTLYRLSIWSENGTVPIFDTPGSGDARNLGVFVRISPLPAVRLDTSEP